MFALDSKKVSFFFSFLVFGFHTRLMFSSLFRFGLVYGV
jgi:hypothetical protein